MVKKLLVYPEKIFGSKLFSFFLLIASILVNHFGAEETGGVFIVTVICAELILCRDTSVTLLPFLLISVFTCVRYDSFNTFIVFLPLVVPVIACIIFHFFAYANKFSVGKTFFPLCLVALSITLGGVGVISAKDYFAPTSVFYIIGLGFGMVIIYLLLRSRYAFDGKNEKSPERKKAVFDRFAFYMYLVGILTAMCVFNYYFKEIDSLKNGFHFVNFQPSNNFSTFLMFSIPFPIYFTMNTLEKRSGNTIFKFSDLHIISSAIMYLAIILTDSRGGLIFGTIMFIITVVHSIYIRSGKRRYIYFVIGVCAVICAIIFGKLYHNYYVNNIFGSIASADEARGGLVFRAIDDFKRNILFGSGLGYKGNDDLYNPVKGAMNWYHMYFAQILGSFGLFGVISFGYMIFNRFKLFLTSPTAEKSALGLSYLGVFTMSFVNPGEFCPIPYEMMTVLIFILLENFDSIKHENTEKIINPLKNTENTEKISAKQN